MENNIINFIKEFHPNIMDEFQRYEDRSNMPEVGTEVKTLVGGYGGYAGVTRYVVGHDDKYIHLAHTPNGKATSLCDIDTWWKELKII